MNKINFKNILLEIFNEKTNQWEDEPSAADFKHSIDAQMHKVFEMNETPAGYKGELSPKNTTEYMYHHYHTYGKDIEDNDDLKAGAAEYENLRPEDGIKLFKTGGFKTIKKLAFNKNMDVSHALHALDNPDGEHLSNEIGSTIKYLHDRDNPHNPFLDNSEYNRNTSKLIDKILSHKNTRMHRIVLDSPAFNERLNDNHINKLLTNPIGSYARLAAGRNLSKDNYDLAMLHNDDTVKDTAKLHNPQFNDIKHYYNKLDDMNKNGDASNLDTVKKAIHSKDLTEGDISDGFLNHSVSVHQAILDHPNIKLSEKNVNHMLNSDTFPEKGKQNLFKGVYNDRLKNGKLSYSHFDYANKEADKGNLNLAYLAAKHKDATSYQIYNNYIVKASRDNFNDGSIADVIAHDHNVKTLDQETLSHFDGLLHRKDSMNFPASRAALAAHPNTPMHIVDKQIDVLKKTPDKSHYSDILNNPNLKEEQISKIYNQLSNNSYPYLHKNNTINNLINNKNTPDTILHSIIPEVYNRDNTQLEGIINHPNISKESLNRIATIDTSRLSYNTANTIKKANDKLISHPDITSDELENLSTNEIDNKNLKNIINHPKTNKNTLEYISTKKYKDFDNRDINELAQDKLKERFGS